MYLIYYLIENFIWVFLDCIIQWSGNVVANVGH